MLLGQRTTVHDSLGLCPSHLVKLASSCTCSTDYFSCALRPSVVGKYAIVASASAILESSSIIACQGIVIFAKSPFLVYAFGSATRRAGVWWSRVLSRRPSCSCLCFQGRVGNPSNQVYLSPADNNSCSIIPSYIARFLAIVWYYGLSFSVFIQDFRSCQVIAVHLLLASNALLLQMFCFWQVTPCSSLSIHISRSVVFTPPQIHIRVLVDALFLRFRFRSGHRPVYCRIIFFKAL